MRAFSFRFAAVAFAAVLPSFAPSLARADVATMALRAVAINDSPIEATDLVVAAPGDTVEMEIHIWGFGTEIPDGIESFSAGVLNRRGAVSGRNGTILPLGWDAPLDQIFCNPSDGGNCPSGTSCEGTGDVGVCRGPDHFPAIGARLNPNRPDFVFAGLETITGISTAELDYTYFGLTTGDEPRIDDGGTWYAGSVSLVVSETACGTFTFFLSKCSGLTLLGTTGGEEIEPLLLPLEIDTGECPLLPTATFPENCVVDARRAFSSDTSGEPLGWSEVMFQFDRNPADTSFDDFVVTVMPSGDVPTIVDVDQIGAVTLILTLDRPISPGYWTCVRHIPSSRVACFGSLPVDVDQSLLSAEVDVKALFPNLAAPDLLSEFQCDIDRSLRCTPQDILEAIDLLNGVGSLPWIGSAIEVSCPSDSTAIFRDPTPEGRGACCNPTSGICQENSSMDACLDVSGVWSSATPCCAAACTASLGSCCDESAGSCIENVAFGECRGAGELWAADSSCDAVECGLPRGACCNAPLGRCFSDVLESQCQRSVNTWTEGATCGDIVCVPR